MHKQNKIRIHSLLPITRQLFSHLQKSRPPSCTTVTWENRCSNSKCLCSTVLLPLPLSFLQILMLILTSYNMEQLFSQFGSALLTISLPNTPNLPTGWVVREREISLILCTHCSRRAKILVCYQHCLVTNPNDNTIPGALNKMNLSQES